jgi:hypothetical protein
MKKLAIVTILALSLLTLMFSETLLTTQGGKPPPPPSLNYIRINQVGYLTTEPKIGLIETNNAGLTGTTFQVINTANGAVAYTGTVGADRGQETLGRLKGPFTHNYVIDFSALTTAGTYKISIANKAADYPFKIMSNAYVGVPAALIQFLLESSCGPRDALVHAPCHLYSSLIDGNPNTHSGDAVPIEGPLINQLLNMEGGWHDAGSCYMKFTQTTTYTAAMLVFAYDYYGSAKFPDTSGNGVPDILDEARWGLEWLLKMHTGPGQLYYQVGNEGDYDVWRIPEQDTTTPIPAYDNRPAYYGLGPNQGGRYAAAMAIAKRLYQSYDPTFATQCLAAGQDIYEAGKGKPVLTTLPYDFYPETTWQDDMEWGATELYKTTGNTQYLTEAKTYAQQTSYPQGTKLDIYEVNAVAHYVLYPLADATTQTFLKAEMKKILDDGVAQANTNPYRVCEPYEWGTASVLMGTSATAIMWNRLFNDATYMDLARQQRDYVLGTNQWGVCWLTGFGTDWTDDPSSCIEDLTGNMLYGAFLEGAAPYLTWSGERWAKLRDPDEYALFNSKVVVYHDDTNDYVTNEPAIDYQCGALFTLTYYTP